MAQGHAKLYSSFARLEKLKNVRTRKDKIVQNDNKEYSRGDNPIQRMLDKYDSYWTVIGWPSAQSPFEFSKT